MTAAGRDWPADLRRREAEPSGDDHTAVAAHRRLYDAASALLRDLADAAGSADGMALAGKFVSVITSHIAPLRQAISDVEFYEKAEEIVSGLRVVGTLDSIAGK